MTATLFGFNIARKIGLRSPIGLGGIAAWRGTGMLMLRRGYPLCAKDRSSPLVGNRSLFGPPYFNNIFRSCSDIQRCDANQGLASKVA
jgi:hypothetical protein